MQGHTVDISTICEYERYGWVMYIDTTWQLPDTKMVLGRYFGPSIDVGSTMTAKILSKTGEVVPRSTLFSLTNKDIENPYLKGQCHKFYEDVIAKLGEPATEAEFTDEGLTPTYDAYVNDMTEGTPD